MKKRRTMLSWSSGKDSAWSLHVLRQDPTVELVGLFSVTNSKYKRVAMHATRETLLERQATAAGLPMQTIELPDPCTNEQCDDAMRAFVERSADDGIQCFAFGDLFLENIRQYRVDQLSGTGIEPIFPLWLKPTQELAQEMLAAGMEAFISSVDLKVLPRTALGKKWSTAFMEEVPDSIDPCGENGEFHSIVTAGPMFSDSINVSVGEVVERDGFAYIDIVPE